MRDLLEMKKQQSDTNVTPQCGSRAPALAKTLLWEPTGGGTQWAALNYEPSGVDWCSDRILGSLATPRLELSLVTVSTQHQVL